MSESNINRRVFLQSAGISAAVTGEALAGTGIQAKKPAAKPAEKPAQKKPEQKKPEVRKEDLKPKSPPVTCAVIGLGPQGREILKVLARLGTGAPTPLICDNFTAPVHVKKSTAIMPKANTVEDYRRILDDNSVQAVFVATPSHQHKQIVLDAIQAGKHVYCEAPLASSIEDAREIAKAGAASKKVFQAGLQVRGNEQHIHVSKFIKSGALGKIASARASFCDKKTWRQSHPDDKRQRELNWRLYNASSLGLIGEVGIHQLDVATWYLGKLPLAVTGFGSVQVYTDGREVFDTVQAVVEYPGGVRFVYTATLGNSYEGSYELFYGTQSAILLRDQRAWMFKEKDSDLLGWEVYARKDNVDIGQVENGTGERVATGIALVADATKQIALGKEPGAVGTDVTKSSLFFNVDKFLDLARNSEDVKNPADAKIGYQATLIAAKANEAAITGSKITFEKDWFNL
jgi:predicted dehydrogenase